MDAEVSKDIVILNCLREFERALLSGSIEIQFNQGRLERVMVRRRVI